MNPLVNFILNSKKAKKDGKLYLTAKKASEEKPFVKDFESTEKEKFARFRSYEKKGELLMIDYENLHRLDNITQQKLKELDSVIWNGLFLKYSDFKRHIHSIFEGAPDYTLIVFQFGNRLELRIERGCKEIVRGKDDRVVCIVTVKEGSLFVA